MVNSYKSQIINIVSLIVGLIALNMTVYGQLDDPQTGMIFILGISGFIALYFIVSYLIINLMERLNEIKDNKKLIFQIKKDLNNLKDDIDSIKDIAELDARISLLEKKK